LVGPLQLGARLMVLGERWILAMASLLAAAWAMMDAARGVTGAETLPSLAEAPCNRTEPQQQPS
jgi:hypothetical protein